MWLPKSFCNEWLFLAHNSTQYFKVHIPVFYLATPIHLQNTLDLGILFLVRYITLIYQFYIMLVLDKKVNAQGKLIQAKAIYFL